jgi:hypothetical protein
VVVTRLVRQDICPARAANIRTEYPSVDGACVSGGVRDCKRENSLFRKTKESVMVNMGVEPRTLALLAPRSKPTELIDRYFRDHCLEHNDYVNHKNCLELRTKVVCISNVFK